MPSWFSSWGTRLQSLATQKIVLLMIGGAIGTYCRYLIGNWFKSQPWASTFPYGTLLINVTGSFLLGIVASIIPVWVPPGQQDRWTLLVGIGFCGGYTTFSTFEYETFNLIRNGSWWLALANVLGSVVAGFLAVVMAVKVVDSLLPRF